MECKYKNITKATGLKDIKRKRIKNNMNQTYDSYTYI